MYVPPIYTYNVVSTILRFYILTCRAFYAFPSINICFNADSRHYHLHIFYLLIFFVMRCNCILWLSVVHTNCKVHVTCNLSHNYTPLCMNIGVFVSVSKAMHSLSHDEIFGNTPDFSSNISSFIFHCHLDHNNNS